MKNRIDSRLHRTISSGEPAVGFFATVGYPDIGTSVKIGVSILDSGADFLELGVPFSDPLAEGPTIQNSSYRALQNGVSLSTCIESVYRIREFNAHTPLIFMGYYNPFLQYGIERFVIDSKRAGVDGLIIPDLPTEEASSLVDLCSKHEIRLIPLLAPTSTDHRIAKACLKASGFIYCVSVTGVTGVRKKIRDNVQALITRIRAHTKLPIIVGFGISTKQHVDEISQFADGVVVGSALMNKVGSVEPEEAADAAASLVRTLKPSA